MDLFSAKDIFVYGFLFVLSATTID